MRKAASFDACGFIFGGAVGGAVGEISRDEQACSFYEAAGLIKTRFSRA